MKYLLVALMLLVSTMAYAKPIDLSLTDYDLPNAKEGAIISFKTEGVEACTTTTLLGYATKYGQIDLDIGGAIAINEPIVALTYKPELSGLGIDMPLSKYFSISGGPYIGFEINEYHNNPNDEWSDALDYGVVVNIVDIKF